MPPWRRRSSSATGIRISAISPSLRRIRRPRRSPPCSPPPTTPIIRIRSSPMWRRRWWRSWGWRTMHPTRTATSVRHRRRPSARFTAAAIRSIRCRTASSSPLRRAFLKTAIWWSILMTTASPCRRLSRWWTIPPATWWLWWAVWAPRRWTVAGTGPRSPGSAVLLPSPSPTMPRRWMTVPSPLPPPSTTILSGI